MNENGSTEPPRSDDVLSPLQIHSGDNAPQFRPEANPNSTTTPQPTTWAPQSVPMAATPQTPSTTQAPVPTPMSYSDIIGRTQAVGAPKNLIGFLPNRALFVLAGALLVGVVVIIIALSMRRTAPASVGSATQVDNSLKSLSSLLRYGNTVSDGPTQTVMGESSLVLDSTQNTLSGKFSGVTNAQDSSNTQIGSDLKSKLDDASHTNRLNSAFYAELKSELADATDALKNLADGRGSATQQALARQATSSLSELYNRLNNDPVPSN
ncbi:MAG: hypothetical protein WAW91_00145 [Candidatus Nanoperiomorbaceae bacterium]